MRLQLALPLTRRSTLLAARPICIASFFALSFFGFFGLFASLAHAQDDETQVTTDVLVYTDNDNVVVVSPQVGARHALDDEGGEVSARYVLDAISAASADVVSSATFKFSELRNEVDLGLSKANGDWLPHASYRYSHEPDYQSHGLTIGANRKFAGGDTTIDVTLGIVSDAISRIDTPKSTFSEELIIQTGEVSATQVVNPKTVVRAVYSLASQLGYMEKPYRSVPLFDAAGLDAAAAAGGLESSNYESYRLGQRPLEEVPDSRFRHAFAVRGLRYVAPINAAVRLDYRFYFDSWGMTAHTVEPALMLELAQSWRLDLHSRFHWQSSVSFWSRAYRVDSVDQIPALRSSDRSLSRSWHSTTGARVERSGAKLTAYLEFNVMVSRFPEFLFLDKRTALIGQAGLRWRI